MATCYWRGGVRLQRSSENGDGAMARISPSGPKWQVIAAVRRNVELSAQRMSVLHCAVQNRLATMREHDSDCQSIVRRSAPGAAMCGGGRRVGEMASSAFSASRRELRTWIIFMLHHRYARLPSITTTAYASFTLSVDLLPSVCVPFTHSKPF